MLIDKRESRGEVIEIKVESKIIEKIERAGKVGFYAFFTKEINLESLEDFLYGFFLERKIKELVIRMKNGHVKRVKQLSWNKKGNRLIYYNDEAKFNVVFTRVGAFLYPDNREQEKNLKKAINFILVLERGGVLN